jgi:hypothetical protein
MVELRKLELRRLELRKLELRKLELRAVTRMLMLDPHLSWLRPKPPLSRGSAAAACAGLR